MSFECPYYNDNYCRLQQGKCQPAIGKCILKGKVKRAKDEDNEPISK
ncbi:MAG TPA: hypothetical protein PK252_14100 [Bacteroidales bacterium]|nr:hypothetical protein [Bacteroidales bacterium]